MEKRSKAMDGEKEDRLSQLPDSVLSRILSRLSTKEAVQTCMLNKAMESKRASITKVHFDDRPIGAEFDAEVALPVDAPRLLKFMESVLAKFQSVLRFTLIWWQDDEYYDPARITSCIDIAFRSNIQKAKIWNRSRKRILLPSCVINCSSLEKLILRYVKTKVPKINVFPNLKRLNLMNVVFLNEKSETDTMRVSFPILEICDLDQCSWQNIKFMNIEAPKLIEIYSCTPRTRRPHVDDCTIKIIGAKIEHFSVSGGCPANFHLHESTVKSAILDCRSLKFENEDDDDDDDDYDDDDDNAHDDSLVVCGIQLRRLLKALTGLKILTLYGDTAEAIASSKEALRVLVGFPDIEYKYVRGPWCTNLEELYVGQELHSEGLLELLRWTPHLKLLSFIEFQETYGKVPLQSLDGLNQSTVPSCILTHLEEVEFDSSFYGCHLKHDLMKYLLENGAVLNRFSISSYDDERVDEMNEKLRSFVPASNSVEIFLGEYFVDVDQ